MGFLLNPKIQSFVQRIESVIPICFADGNSYNYIIVLTIKDVNKFSSRQPLDSASGGEVSPQPIVCSICGGWLSPLGD